MRYTYYLMRRTKGEGTYETSKTGKVRLVKKSDGQRVYGPWSNSKAEALQAFRQKQSQPSPSKNLAAQKHIRELILELYPEMGDPHPIILELLANKSISTRSVTRRQMLALASQPIAAFRVSDITPTRLQKWVDQSNLKPRTLANYFEVLRLICNLCDVDIQRPKFPLSLEPEGAIVHTSDWLEYLELATEPWHKVAMHLMCRCGLRRSEALAIRKQDFIDGELLIRGSVHMEPGVGPVYRSNTKTNRLRRVPVIDQWLVDFIDNAPEGFLIYRGSPENPKSPTVVTDTLTKLAQGTKFEGVSPQDLRRSAATAFATSNVPMPLAEQVMGHSSLMLKRVYSRINADQRAEALRQAFKESLENG